MYTCIYVYMYICIHVYVCMYVCMYVCLFVCLYVCVYIYIYIHMFAPWRSGSSPDVARGRPERPRRGVVPAPRLREVATSTKFG